MNNLSSNCGLVDAKIRASPDKDLPVTTAQLNKKKWRYEKYEVELSSKPAETINCVAWHTR